MTVRTVTVYANVKATLGRRAARRALAKVLAAAEQRTGQPADVIGLGEWPRRRAGILAALPGYKWRRPVRGGGPIGLNRHRFGRLSVRSVKLVGRTRVEPDPGNPRRILPPSRATLVRATDRRLRRRRAWLLFHLTAGVQDAHGHYKHDTNPGRVARHMAEVRAVAHHTARLEAKGYVVEALGDGNYHGLRIPGLVSAAPPPDLGRRAVSDVFGQGPAVDAFDVPNASDHDGIVVVREDLEP